jgi:CBS domain-containing protein
MIVSEILQLKGATLFTATPETSLGHAIDVMAEKDIGSLVIMSGGALVGMLTFRELILTLHQRRGVREALIGSVMDKEPLTCTPKTDVNEVRRMMLEHHVRYLPVLDGATLLGVISFFDVAKAVLEAQNFENQMLKAYIRDWPVEATEAD